MQLYLPGTNPLYWQQIDELPDGIYNKTVNQTSSATIKQLFTAFVGLPIGTPVDIYMSVDNGNLNKVATAKVVDETGFLYAKLPIPYSRSIDQVEITLKEHGPNFSAKDKTIASEIFGSGHIAYTFEVRAQAANQGLVDSVQLEQDLTIDGVEDELLYPKFGIYTPLSRRADQSMNQYRGQTACLWKAFQYAATEKGIMDAIRCVIGDFDGTAVSVAVSSTKSSIPNEVFAYPQYGATGAIPGYFVDNSATSGTRWDEDYPHYYVPDGIGAGYYIDGNSMPTLDIMGPYLYELQGTVWDVDTVQVFTIPNAAAIGNESTSELTSSVSLGIPEEAAVANVAEEGVYRQSPAPGISATGPDNPDRTANEYLAIDVVVKSCIINGIEVTELADLPVEDIDFQTDRISGKIIWFGTAKTPDANTLYNVSYKFRLDNQLRQVLYKIKPVQKVVSIVFSNITSDLPRSLVI